MPDRVARRFRFAILLFVAALLVSTASAQSVKQRPYVVLVSLDGFRYDYAARYNATNLLAIGKAGVAAEGLIPVFPTLTFPNHISIVTGLYPEHHGIVENGFYDPIRKEFYGMGAGAQDGSWYRAKPLWVLAEEQNVKSATMFWPSSDAEIFTIRPSYWKAYDMSFPNEQRIAQVLNWLKLPEAQRPHLVTLYMSDVDAAGHKFGPESAETAAAVQRIDKLVGELWRNLQALNLPINLIVVSDHGMQKVEGFVDIGPFADFKKVKVDDAGVFTLVYAPDSEAAEQMYFALKAKSPKFDVYRRKETPPQWHFSEDLRIGDLIVIAKGPNMIGTEPPSGGVPPLLGEHGFDPAEFPTMKGIFYAVGSNIKPGVRVSPFENVNIFPLITKILGLKNLTRLDGSEKPLAGVYRP